MTRRAILVLALAAIGVGCDSVTSIRSIVTDADELVVDSRIEGEWISPDLDHPGVDERPASRWTIARAKDSVGHYVVEWREVGDEPDRVTVYDGSIVTIGGTMFFDAEFREDRVGQTVIRSPSGVFLPPGHVVGRLWLEDDFVRIGLLAGPWVRANLPERSWLGHSERYTEDVLITAPTDDVRRLLIDHADDLNAFALLMYLCRPGADCKPRVVEDALGRATDPDDADERTDFAADVFAARGDHARAVALRQQRVAFAPQDPWRRIALGEAWLLHRHFAEGRRELAAAAALAAAPPSDPESADAVVRTSTIDTIWSDFLEGRYAEVVKAVDGYHPSPLQASADPILLDYHARIRLGRRRDADARLRARTASFVGPSGEHLLLLAAERRLADVVLRSDSSHARENFFAALGELADGHVDRAASALRSASGEPDSLVALAARIELERLAAAEKR